MANSASPTNRTVRIFISSTFQDMHAERDYLIRHVFPALRVLCRERQVELIEVDLRWGITRKQAERGETLPRCLDTIHDCRPYFIGLIGNRYGWVPKREDIPKYLFEEHPWLNEHLNRSVTELEILHGVLNNPEMSERAFFYFLDNSIKKSPHAIEESPAQQKKLKKLKSSIRSALPAYVRDYTSKKSLGTLVLNDLWEAIQKEFPSYSVPDNLSRWALEQDAFAASRLQIFTPRQDWRKILSKHIATTSLPLVLTGESGIGKSSLLADWINDIRKKYPSDCLLFHFVGVSPESSRPEIILRRFMAEMQRIFNLTEVVPESSSELASAFRVFLAKAAAKERVVLVIDALNQIEGDKGIELSWLPRTFPENVRAIFSTIPGPTLNLLRERKWHILTLEPPNAKILRRMANDYLKHYAKTLEADHVERIAESPQAGNPLFLRALLDELRITARFGKVEKTLANYLEAATPADLFELMLSRWESDYNYRGNGLVQDSLALLAVSRRGLSENEMLEILGDLGKNKRMAQARWTPFYLAASNYLINRSGFFWFFHDHLRQAVERRYLSKPKDRCEVIFRLTDFYCEQISRDKEQGGIYRALAIDVAEDAVSCAEQTHNRRLQAQAYLNCSGALLSAAVGISDANVEHFHRMVELVAKGCELAKLAGAKDIEADALCRRAVDETMANPDFGNLAFLDKAIALRMARNDREGVRDALRDKARIGMRLNRLDITEAALHEADAIQKRLKNPGPEWTNIHRHQYWGECLALQGKWGEALKRLHQALAGAKHDKRPGEETAAIGWIGLVQCHLGKEDIGLPLVRTALEREKDILQSQEGVAKWLVELGRLFDRQGNTKRALHALWLAEDIYQEIQHSALRWAEQLLNEIAARDNDVYQKLRSLFNPFTAEFAPYCSLWGLPPLKRISSRPTKDHKLPATNAAGPHYLMANGLYWRFQTINNALHAVCSEDGKKWNILQRPLLLPRNRHFDETAIIPGPTPIETPEGVLLVYGAIGKSDDGQFFQAIGQALLDPASPTRVMRRSYRPLYMLPGSANSREDLPQLDLGELIKKSQGWTLPINGRQYLACSTNVI